MESPPIKTTRTKNRMPLFIDITYLPFKQMAKKLTTFKVVNIVTSWDNRKFVQTMVVLSIHERPSIGRELSLHTILTIPTLPIV